MIKFFKFIFELPVVIPVLFIYTLYATYMVVKQSDIDALMEIETEEQFDTMMKPILESFKSKYINLLYAVSTIAWLYIIKTILLWN